jgi:hypothetical protein
MAAPPPPEKSWRCPSSCLQYSADVDNHFFLIAITRVAHVCVESERRFAALVHYKHAMRSIQKASTAEPVTPVLLKSLT